MRIDLTDCLLKRPEKALSTVLWIVASHSFLLGVGLILQPPTVIKCLGFEPIGEPFFPAQGGTFHMCMGIAYLMGAVDIEKYYSLILFSIIVKSGAALFLTLYCIVVDFKWFILFCAIIDAVMGLAIFIVLKNYLYFKTYRKSTKI